MSARCPSDLALEEHLLARTAPAPRASTIAEHVLGCERCHARLAQMEREAQDFRRFVFPQTIDRVEEAAGAGPRRNWLRMLLPVPAVAAAAAAVLFLVRPVGPPDDYVGIKGAGDLGLTVFTQAANGDPRILADGAQVPAAAALRFRVRSAAACKLVVVSVDADGNVSRLDPAGPEGFALAAGGQDLPGGAQLDGKAGPERVFAACGPELTSQAVLDAAARAASGGASAVRRPSALGHLPPGTTQATLLIEKTP
jgi:hypothetical protein